MPDKYNRPVAWSLALDYLEDGLDALGIDIEDAEDDIFPST